MLNLSWRTVTPTNSPRYLVRGTVLNAAYIPGTLSRFLIEEIRAHDKDGYSVTTYRLRDATTVSDAEIRAGKSSAVVARSDDYEALAAHARELWAAR